MATPCFLEYLSLHRNPYILKWAMWGLDHNCITPMKPELSQPDDIGIYKTQREWPKHCFWGCSQNALLSGFSVSIICKQATSSMNRPAGKQKGVWVIESLLPGTWETTSILMCWNVELTLRECPLDHEHWRSLGYFKECGETLISWHLLVWYPHERCYLMVFNQCFQQDLGRDVNRNSI